MYESFANSVDPIADHKLQGAFNVIKQLNEIQELYRKLAPAERSAAAIKGLRHDANENDLILSAYVMQADRKVRDQVRAAYADQQSVLHTNEANRMNYMNPDATLRAVGKASAEDRFDKLFAQTQPTLDHNDVVKPKNSVIFADRAQNKVNASVDSKSETQPTVEKRGDFQNATKKTPPVPPDQSLKPSHRTAPVPLDQSLKPSHLTAPAHRTNTTLGAPGFGVRKPDVRGQQPVQTQGSSKGGPAHNTQPPHASMPARRVVEESAFAEKTVDSKIQQLRHELNLQPKKLTNSHQ